LVLGGKIGHTVTDMDKHDAVRLTGVALDNVEEQQAEGFIIYTW